MYRESGKAWLHYINDIIAADVYSAVFMASYIRHTNIHKHHAASLEVIDLQRYRVVKPASKVRQVLQDRNRKPFVFIVGKN